MILQPEADSLLREKRENNQQSSVILPMRKTSIRDFVFPSDPRHRFLPGNRPEVTKGTCGNWMWRGCLDHEKHGLEVGSGQSRLTGGLAIAQDIVEKYELSCGKLSCPVCYEKACGKASARIENRMMQFRRKGISTKYYHWSVSVPKTLYYSVASVLRKKSYEIAKMAGIQGGCCIYHETREYNEDDLEEDLATGFSWKTAPASWYYSPHFHFIGVGFTSSDKVKNTYEKTGWVVKNLGERDNIKSTAHYQLSHCYVPVKGHAITWFGVMAYNKLKVKPLPPQEHICPGCGSEFRKLKFVSSEAEAIVKSMVSKDGIYRFDHGFFSYIQLVFQYEGG